MEIYLIRHTSPLIAKGLIYGHTDVPLADTFLAEQETVLQQLPESIDAVYSSPSLRCTQLAASIAKVYPAVVYREDQALRELNFGDWEGQTWDRIDRQESEAWMSDFVHLSPPNGETMLQMEMRVMRFLKTLLRQPLDKVAVVTHGGVIRIILAHYKSIALKDSFTIGVAMGAVFKLELSNP